MQESIRKLEETRLSRAQEEIPKALIERAPGTPSEGFTPIIGREGGAK